MVIRLKETGILYSMIALFVALVYSYKDSTWVNEIYAMYFKRGNTSSLVYIALLYSALLIIILISFKEICKKKSDFIFSFILISATIFYFVKSFLDDGFYLAITSPTTPLVYLIVLAVFSGKQQIIWQTVKKILPWIICGHVGVLVYEYFMLVYEHGVVVVGNSSLIFYFVSLFWCSVVYLTDWIANGNVLKVYHLMLLGFLIIFSVIINSRSWIIQSCIISICLYLLASSNISIRKRIIRALVFVGVFFIIWELLNNTFSNSLMLLFEKFGQDSRSHQYRDIFRAFNTGTWLWGNGALATYYDSAQGYISNIDNQYLFIIFHYGLAMLVLWLAPQLIGAYKIWKNKNVPKVTLLPIVCWFMALGGLSVFNGVYCDFKQVILMLYIGRMLSLCENEEFCYE